MSRKKKKDSSSAMSVTGSSPRPHSLITLPAGTELARLESGELVPVHPDKYLDRAYKVVDGKKRSYEVLRKHHRAWVLPVPDQHWTDPDFDDSRWPSLRGPFCITGYYKHERARYRSVPLLCLRGKFFIGDLSKTDELRLSASFRRSTRPK